MRRNATHISNRKAYDEGFEIGLQLALQGKKISFKSVKFFKAVFYPRYVKNHIVGIRAGYQKGLWQCEKNQQAKRLKEFEVVSKDRKNNKQQDLKQQKTISAKRADMLQMPPPFLSSDPSTMELLPKELEQRFLEVGCQEDEPDPLVICKLFDPSGKASWLATEYNPENRRFFGYLTGIVPNWGRWGHFNLNELSAVISIHPNSPLERDVSCDEKRLSEHCPWLVEEVKRKKEMIELEFELACRYELER